MCAHTDVQGPTLTVQMCAWVWTVPPDGSLTCGQSLHPDVFLTSTFLEAESTIWNWVASLGWLCSLFNIQLHCFRFTRAWWWW